MAVIPRLDVNVPLSSGPTSRVDSSAASQQASGVGIGDQLAGLGGVLSEAAIKKQAQVNQINVANAMTNTMQVLMDKQTEVLQRKGVNALGTAATRDNPATPSASDDFAQFSSNTYKSALDSLDNDTQKQKFTQWYQSQQPAMHNTVVKWQDQQATIAQSDSNKAQMNMNSLLFKSSILNGDYNTASTAIRNGLSMSQQMGSLMGIPQDAQSLQDNQYFYNTMADTVKDLINSNQFQNASNVVNYYKAHLTGDQVATLNGAIQKSYAPVMSRERAALAMQQNNNDVLKAKRSIPITDPNYDQITKNIASMGADIKVEQAAQEKQAKIEMNRNILRLNSVDDAVSYTTKMVDAGLMTADTANAIVKRQQEKSKASLDPKTNWAVGYDSKPITSSGQTGLERDGALIKEYQARLTDPADVISPSEQTKYDKAASNLNTYWNISSGGTYNQKDQQDTTDEWTAGYNQTFKAAEYLAQHGMTKDQIIEKATPTLEKMGIDVDTWANQVDWESIGL
jgi:hypothetical protein